jgi:penicillin-binding protein 2
LNKTPEEIKAIYAPALPDWYWPIGDVAGDLLQEHAAAIQPHIGKGLTASERLTRLYTPEGVAAHVVGYTSPIPAEQAAVYRAMAIGEMSRWARPALNAGAKPICAAARGGRLTIVGPSGEFIRTVQEIDPRQARSLYTTFERDFQWSVEQALAQAIRSHPLAAAGSIVVMDVNNGHVLAMASYPTYNPAVFDSLRTDAAVELGAVLSDPGRPLLNRAAQSAYPTGSVFKVVTMAAGLNSGLYTPESRYTSTGSWNGLGDAFIKYDWREGGHGTVSLRQAITVSCNSCFYDVGLNVHNQNRELLPETARQFGLGALTGIQGVNETPGLVPDNAWKLATYGEGWSPGDAVNMSIGQGFVQTTPLQIANIFAAIANGGTLYRPT